MTRAYQPTMTPEEVADWERDLRAGVRRRHRNPSASERVLSVLPADEWLTVKEIGDLLDGDIPEWAVVVGLYTQGLVERRVREPRSRSGRPAMEYRRCG